MTASDALCHYCGTRIGTTRDHIVPKSWRGRGQRNLVRACGPCNRDKGAEPPTCGCTYCTKAVMRWLLQNRPLLAAMEPGGRQRVLLRRINTLERIYLGMVMTTPTTQKREKVLA